MVPSDLSAECRVSMNCLRQSKNGNVFLLIPNAAIRRRNHCLRSEVSCFFSYKQSWTSHQTQSHITSKALVGTGASDPSHAKWLSQICFASKSFWITISPITGQMLMSASIGSGKMCDNFTNIWAKCSGWSDFCWLRGTTSICRVIPLLPSASTALQRAFIVFPGKESISIISEGDVIVWVYSSQWILPSEGQ